MGARGIERTYLYDMIHGCKATRLTLSQGNQRARHHLRSKIASLHEYLLTSSAKKLGRRKQAIVREFLKDLDMHEQLLRQWRETFELSATPHGHFLGR
jgi:hypothetical protein